jgi:hypothetical protein
MRHKEIEVGTMSYPKKAPCPCGSGKKYRQCCANKSFKFVYKDGLLQKVTPVGRDVMEALAQVRRAFKKKFARDRRPGEPIFFDPDEDTPKLINLEKYRRAVVAGMRAAGVDPAHVYAFERSGYFVTEQNRELIPDRGIREWHAAVDEWRSRYAS